MAKKTTKLVASSKAIDPTLDALFAGSSGPVHAPSKSRYSGLLEKKPRDAPKEVSLPVSADDDDEELSEISEELNYDDEEEEDDGDDDDDDNDDDASSSEVESEDDNEIETQGDISMSEPEVEAREAVEEQKPRRDRKRKRKDNNDDLEAKYLADLTKDDPKEPAGKRQKAEEGSVEVNDDEDDDDVVPAHESIVEESKDKDSDIEKANRTVFLANVSIDAVSSKAAKKTLITHLSSALDPNDMPAQKFESIRFRSLAFSTGSMPKRAAYITKSLMGATTKSANAYAVFSTPAAARLVASKLNGTEVLGRHIRVDSVAHPSATDHRRCIFVGNLGFIDDETVVSVNENGEKVEKKRTKVPADAEEGLWRTFGKIGRVENVRVVRDSKTRVGKGIAYVQFYDANDVEAALLLDGKKYPPLLPRILRITRAKDPRKTALAQERSKAKAQAADRQARSTKYTPKLTHEQQAAAGRANRLLGRGGGFMHRKKAGGEAVNGGGAASQRVVFEGNRATSRNALPKDLKFGKGKKHKKGPPKTRGARRAAEWKKKS
ncbi:Nucleolar protein 12 [Conoideocrella luteorostrata]|uniref:Nucleolar protein 12 n=1 Tax=Conoideocrella luteorostrata TaxID=1105319 RepID=A0AAJ0CXD1_9HYPO|nr:Nucleolar protein 12 [Conoideocrella luteorostrata]